MTTAVPFVAVFLHAALAVDPSSGNTRDSKIAVAADGSLSEIASSEDAELDRYWEELEKGFHEHSRADESAGGLYSFDKAGFGSADSSMIETDDGVAHTAQFYVPSKFDSLLEASQDLSQQTSPESNHDITADAMSHFKTPTVDLGSEHMERFQQSFHEISSRAAHIQKQGMALAELIRQDPTATPAPTPAPPAPTPPPAAGEPTPAPDSSSSGGTSYGMYIFLGILAVHAAIVVFMVIQGVWGWEKKSFWGFAVIILTGGLINAYGTKLLLDPDATLNFMGNVVCVGISAFNVVKAIPCMCCIESVRDKAKACGGLLCQGILHLLIAIIYICVAQFLYASITLLMCGIGPFIGACMIVWGWFAGDESLYDAAMEYLTDVGNQISAAAEQGWEDTQGAFGFGEESRWQGPNTVIITDCGESGVIDTYQYQKSSNSYAQYGKEPETSKYIIRYNNGSWQLVKQKNGAILYYSKIGMDPVKGPPDHGWLVKEGERPGPKCTLEDFNEVSVLVDFKGQMDSLQSMSTEWGQAFGLIQEDVPEVPRTICVVEQKFHKEKFLVQSEMHAKITKI